MQIYSIVRMGNDYVVQAEKKSVLRIASRRRAAQLIVRAEVLLNAQAAAPDPRAHGDASSCVTAHEVS